MIVGSEDQPFGFARRQINILLCFLRQLFLQESLQ